MRFTYNACSLLEQAKFDISNLTHDEYEIGKKLITDYYTIFSKDETDVEHTTLLKQRIYLHNSLSSAV
jgi:hypothetical protein